MIGRILLGNGEKNVGTSDSKHGELSFLANNNGFDSLDVNIVVTGCGSNVEFVDGLAFVGEL